MPPPRRVFLTRDCLGASSARAPGRDQAASAIQEKIARKISVTVTVLLHHTTHFSSPSLFGRRSRSWMPSCCCRMSSSRPPSCPAIRTAGVGKIVKLDVVRDSYMIDNSTCPRPGTRRRGCLSLTGDRRSHTKLTIEWASPLLVHRHQPSFLLLVTACGQTGWIIAQIFRSSDSRQDSRCSQPIPEK